VLIFATVISAWAAMARKAASLLGAFAEDFALASAAYTKALPRARNNICFNILN
jgi:hypothetical protein